MTSTNLLSLLSLFLSMIVAFITFLILNFILKPYIQILNYSKQPHIKTIFHKFLIPLPSNSKNAETKGDYYFTYKDILRKHPDTKVIVENFANRPHMVITSKDVQKEFLQKINIYHKDTDLYGLAIELARGSFVFAEDSEWKQKRRMVSKAFNFEFLKNIVPMIIDVSQKNFSEWIHRGELTEVPLLEKMGLITGEVTCQFFFGNTVRGKVFRGVPLSIGMQRLFIDMYNESYSLSMAVFGTKLIKANILPRHREMNRNMKELRKICSEMIQEVKNRGDSQSNLLSILLEGSQGDEKDTKGGSVDGEIVGEFVGIFGAGTETTANFLSFMVYFLWKHPDVFQKVKNEVDDGFSDLKKLDYEALNKMEYITAFMKETLRFAFPNGNLFTRVALKDDDLCGIKVKKGTLFNIYEDVFFSSDKYFTEPEKFVPERWLSSSPYPNDGHKLESYAFTPFSGGPRNCIGQYLAMAEGKITLGLFIKTFEFTFAEDTEFVLVQKMMFQPRKNLKVNLKQRL